ncbi:MAG: acetyl-CoA carboxylase biotin carboxyl carrier protein [Saprospiraceae bacterium]
MNFNEIQELIKLVNKSNLAEFKMKNKDFELLIRTEKYQKSSNQAFIAAPQMAPANYVGMPQVPVAPAPVTKADGEEEKGSVVQSKNIMEIKSPIVGTFYRSPSPDKPLFVKVGDHVKEGDVVCIIEAMKLFNEIESDITGTIIKVLVEDASPVEYDQVLYLVEV